MDKKRIIFLSLIILLFIILIIVSILYYNGKYTVTFETGTNENIISQHLKRGEVVKKPNDPTKEGYIFLGWENRGEEYDFNTKIYDDIVLSANWKKEAYITISFNTNSLYEIDDIKVLKGSSIDDLPVVTRDGYEFIGWLLNDKLYEGEELNSDTTFTALFELSKGNFKIGDIVLIIGSYSSSSVITNYNTKAIGWDRIVLDYIEGAENPYVVGNESGITGFFKEESLKKIKEA